MTFRVVDKPVDAFSWQGVVGWGGSSSLNQCNVLNALHCSLMMQVLCHRHRVCVCVQANEIPDLKQTEE